MSAVELDHLVVAAATLDDGVRWCERILGATPGGGGRHDLMGTHNRLLSIASSTFEFAYLEVIAIAPDAPAPARRRWFGLDEPALQRSLRRDGPRLVHWVARCADLDATRAALLAAGLDPGVPTAASRGDYRWRITLRDDGLPQRGGTAPALIEWHSAHPAAAMPALGVTLESLVLPGLEPPQLAALDCAPPIAAGAGGPGGLVAALSTPRGEVTLRS